MKRAPLAAGLSRDVSTTQGPTACRRQYRRLNYPVFRTLVSEIARWRLVIKRGGPGRPPLLRTCYCTEAGSSVSRRAGCSLKGQLTLANNIMSDSALHTQADIKTCFPAAPEGIRNVLKVHVQIYF